MYIFAPHLKTNKMTREQMMMIRKEYVIQASQDIEPYLCHVAVDVGIRKEFEEYLVNNLDDTMINDWCDDKNNARWDSKDTQSRLDWLDKHIELLTPQI